MRRPLCFAAMLCLLPTALANVAGAWDVGALDQQVVFTAGVDGSPAYSPYPSVRIPALAVTQQGTLLAFCEGRPSGWDLGNVDIILKRSLDGGNSWLPTQCVRDDGSNTIDDPCPIVDRTTGEILLLHNRNDAAATEDSIMQGLDQREVWITKSANDGATWSTATQITSSVNPPNTAWQSVGPGGGIQLSSGRLVVPCTRTEIGVPFTSSGAWRGYAAYSDDHGATWHYGADAVPDADENSMVELASGQVMMVVRRDLERIGPTLPSRPQHGSGRDLVGRGSPAGPANLDLPGKRAPLHVGNGVRQEPVALCRSRQHHRSFRLHDLS